MTWLRPVRWLPLGGLLLGACVKPEAPPPPPSPAAAPQPATPAVRPGTVGAISLSAFFPLQQNAEALVYDVRPEFFHRLGHIPGSLSWPKRRFDSDLAAREPELAAATRAKRPVVLYCTDRECPDAGWVARKLAARGYSTSLLEGGYADWKAAELPVE